MPDDTLMDQIGQLTVGPDGLPLAAAPPPPADETPPPAPTLPSQLGWLDSDAGHPLFPGKSWSWLQNNQIINIPQISAAMSVADHFIGGAPAFRSPAEVAPADRQLPQELLDNPPPDWGGYPEPSSVFGPPGTPGLTQFAGGTTYESPEAYRRGDWQAHLQSRTGFGAIPHVGDRATLDAIPQEMLDKYWPVTGGTPAGVPGPAQAGVVGLKYDTSKVPTQGDPMGGWYTFQQRHGVGWVPEPISAFSDLPSTDNYRLLPAGYNRPGFIMRNGRILDTNSPGFKVGLGAQGTWRPDNVAGVSSAFYHVGGWPGGFGQVPYAYFGWPGDIDAWLSVKGGWE